MTHQEIINLINTYIKTNGQGDITGSRLNTVLNALADYFGVDSVEVTTLPAGSEATAYMNDNVLYLGIPKGEDGQDGEDAVNPFKGWWPDLATLKASITATAGSSAYVKDPSPANTWSIYIYDSTASSNNYWADSGTKADTSNVQLVPSAVKKAIYDIASNAAFINDNGYSSQLNVIQAWSEELLLLSITANFDQTGVTVYTTDSLNSLKAHLTVTATYDDSSTLVLPSSSYVLSGSLTEGVSVITVTYQGKTDTFNVIVSASPYLYVLPSAFTSNGTSRVDTGFMYAKSHVYTILADIIPSVQDEAQSVYIYSNKKTLTSSVYIGVTRQLKKIWGNGIPFGVGAIVNAGVRFRSAAVVTVDSAGVISTVNYYVVGSGAITSQNNSYTGDNTDPTLIQNIILGNYVENENTGFKGVVNSFAIYDGEMSNQDITNFLINGM